MAITDNTAFAKKAAVQPLVELQPRAATNIRIPQVLAATGVAQNCPSVPVAPGLTVTLIGVVGQAANAHDVFVASYPEELAAGGGRRVPAGAEVQYPVDNTGQIWFQGTAADGLLITVTGVAVG
jgi:hypothetical protein